jgi:parvulin-like peptidyl-prolyl isomerase
MNASSTDIDLKQIDDYDIVEFLRHTLQYNAIHQAVFSQRIISRAAEERQIIVNDDDIQKEADRQRHELRLERSSDTLEWLQSQRITPENWESGIRIKLLEKKLKEALFEPEINQSFNQNRLNFDKVILYQIVVPYAALAQELFYQIEEEEISFYEAAHMYDVDENRRYRCGYEGAILRWNLPPLLASALLGIPSGKLAGPVETEQGYHLLLPEKVIPAELTDEVRQEIRDRLFQEWLASEITYWQYQ